MSREPSKWPWSDCLQHGKYMGDHCKACETSASPSPVSTKEQKDLENEAPVAFKAGDPPPQTASTPRSLSELLPCPFCGNEAELEEWTYQTKPPVTYRRIYCENFDCHIKPETARCATGDIYEVRQWWNKRAAPSVVDGTAAHPAQNKPNPPASPVSLHTDEEEERDLGEKEADVNTITASKAATKPI